MSLSFTWRPHWRHHWEFVENPTTGGQSRRCTSCGRFQVLRGSAARRAGANPGDHGNPSEFFGGFDF